jgi:Luciferase-like monooxygenase
MRLGVSLAGFAVAAETTNVAGRAVEPGSQAGRPGLGSVWFAQMASYDALAVASAAGRAVPRISAGTAVVPIYPRHPQVLASAAKTAQAATGGRFQLKSTTPATPRPPSVDTRPREGRPGTGDDGLASVAETLAGLTAAARSGGLDDTAALSALAAARGLAAELERSELALIEAARDGGATWSRIATAMDARNRQTAQKRHADLVEIDQIMAAAVPVGGPTPEGMA